MKDRYRAIVIGGGVVGCSVLYHLAKAGWKDVLLIERSELTSGSSWHAAGGFHTLNGDPNVAKLQAYTVSLYKELEELSGQTCGLHLTGGAMMADSPERMDFLKHTHAKGRYLGMSTEIITPSEVKEMFPLLDESHFVGALWDPVEGHLDPSGTTHAYAKSAKILGAEISLRNRVVELNQNTDGIWNVITEKGNIQAEHVVNAGGLWAREVGRMVGLELPLLAMEHHYLLTDEIPEVVEFNERTGKEVIHVIDFKGEIYTRQEQKGILLGTYEQACEPWSPIETPWTFGHELLEPNLERISPSLEVGFKHFPPLEKAGIRKMINGPFTFAPDGNPLIGPVPGLTNYWSACAVMAGFSQGGGVGLALSNWMINGDPGHDVFGMDVARFGDFATLRYTNAKVRENYSRRFRISFPNEELEAGRPHQTTPIYDLLVSKNAVMGNSWGLENALWFAPSQEEAKDVLSFHRSNDFKSIKNEVKSVRERVGLTEISNFAKYKITGIDAESWLSELMTNNMPKIGRMVLTPMLNEFGKVIGDFTIAQIEKNVFYIWGSQNAQKHHMRWFNKNINSSDSVNIECIDQKLVGLSIAGPKSRSVLQKLVDRDISNNSFKFMSSQKMDVAGAPCIVSRITFTGDLGFEIWMEPSYQRNVYLKIKAAGEEFKITDFGTRALLSMRLEKNFPTWGHELRPIYGPFECSLDRFVKLDKNKFVGSTAAREELDNGPNLKRVSLIIDAEDADVMGDEPIWAKVPKGEFTQSVTEAKSNGGPTRFNETGKPYPKITSNSSDGDWNVVGWVTSGGYGHYVDLSLAQGYIPFSLFKQYQDTKFQVEILGKKYNAEISVDAPFDPSGSVMRG